MACKIWSSKLYHSSFVEKEWCIWFAHHSKENNKCDACILGKHSKLPLHESNFRASRKLELVHSDLCGPMPTPSANGNKYFLKFVDDYSRMCWIYYLKTKSEAFQTVKDFHALIEKQAQ